tara:strand:- start:4695 stop:4952 length:258 start_codon:yes stop_codon:yes gene_type:complete
MAILPYCVTKKLACRAFSKKTERHWDRAALSRLKVSFCFGYTFFIYLYVCQAPGSPHRGNTPPLFISVVPDFGCSGPFFALTFVK